MAASALYDEDQYLNQLTPVLLTYWNTLHDITNIKLVIKPQLEDVSRVVNICINSDVTVPLLPLAPFPSTRSHSPLGDSCITANKEALSLLQLVSVYDDKLKHVLMKCITKERDLNESDCLSGKLNNLIKLKEAVEEFSAVEDKVLEYYSVKYVGLQPKELEPPSIEQLKKLKDTFCSLKNCLELKELYKLFAEFDHDFMTSEEVILCALLGLDSELGEWIANMNTFGRTHQTVSYYLTKHVAFGEEYPDLSCNNNTARASVVENLIHLGFTNKRAAIIVNNIPDDMIDLQFPKYWAERYLEHAFHYHPLLEDVDRFPYSLKKTNEWFTEVFSAHEPEEPDGDDSVLFQIDMINFEKIDTTLEHSMIQDLLKDASENDSNTTFLYYGTSHLGAISILKYGINLHHGIARQDFSHRDGFYLYEKFEVAKSWSTVPNTDQYQAVVVFKVPKDLLNVDEHNGLDVTANKELWENIVRLCRTEYNRYNEEEKRKLLSDKSFIKGPVCLNPKEVVHNIPAQGFGQDNVQLCLRGRDYVEKLVSLKNICCVMFY